MFSVVLCSICVCRYAAAVQDGSQYFVLLIITDGVISDMAQTKEAIVNVRMGRRGSSFIWLYLEGQTFEVIATV